MNAHRQFVHVVEAKYLGRHRVWLRFDDGLAGEVDLAPHLEGEVLEPLQSPDVFSRFTLGDARTLAWPNGADFAPEFLHDLLARAAVPPDGD